MGVEKPDRANPYRGHRLPQLAQESLARIGAATRGMTPEEFAPLALTFGPVRGAQTTSATS